MSKAKNFDTIWRERFAPALIDIPREGYRDYMPCVHMIPWAVYDARVIATDEKLSALLAKAIKAINDSVESVPPRGIGIPILQLIRQVSELLSGRNHILRVFGGHRVLKQIYMTPSLLEECQKLQSVMLERLFLFEDFGAAIPPSEVDGWADMTSGRLRSFSHAFAERAKLDALIQLVHAHSAKKIAIFVRNIPVCEALFNFVEKRGVEACFAHGEVDEGKRQASLRQFKRGQAQVLIVTRQLFGRGFDLPEADLAILYSPKDSEKTVWQEMLRIRSTVRKLKTCFVLFYAWTAEAAKMERLLRRILRTGGVIHEFYVRWSFFEEEEEFMRQEAHDRKPEGAAAFEPEARSQPTPGTAALEATRRFVSDLVGSMEDILRRRRDEVLKWLRVTAEKCGFLTAWPREFVEMLLRELSATFESYSSSEPTSVKKALSKVFHPDKHPHAGPTEKQFWHEMFVALQS